MKVRMFQEEQLDKVFKNRSSTIFKRLSSANFTWSIHEYFVPNGHTKYCGDEQGITRVNYFTPQFFQRPNVENIHRAFHTALKPISEKQMVIYLWTVNGV